MPETMRCLQVHEWGEEPALNEVEVPEIGPTEALVEVEATSVGLTVDHAIHGRTDDDPANLPRIPGHEVVGTVAAVGDGVTHVAPGDRVTTHFYLFCGHCEACLDAREPLCADLRGHVGVNRDGGYAEYAALPGRNLIQLPAGLDPVDATVVPDAVATPYHVAAERARIEPGDEVAVLGAGGGVGIHMVQMARGFGADVTAVDRDDDKLDRCVDLGAARAVNTARRSLAEAAADEGAAFDAAIDFSGADTVVADAIDALAPGGRFVNLTTVLDEPVAVESADLVRSEIEVVGSRYCSRAELKRAAGLVADGTIEPVISSVVDLDGVPDLLAEIRRGDLLGRGATIP